MCRFDPSRVPRFYVPIKKLGYQLDYQLTELATRRSSTNAVFLHEQRHETSLSSPSQATRLSKFECRIDSNANKDFFLCT